jgi:hypothetical protein
MKYTDENREKYLDQSVPANEISRRDLLRRAGQRVLGLTLGSLLLNQPTDASAARLKRMLPAATILPLAAVQQAGNARIPTLQTPYWGDGTALDQPQFYMTIQAGRRPQINKTIQSADIDGDGQDELLVRTPKGIIVHHFNPVSGQWDPMQQDGPPLNDANGWSGPAYYETIQTADINNDGRAEIIVRGGNGIQAWKYTPSGPLSDLRGKWDALENGPEWSDAYGWNKPEYYQTIQCADIDGDTNIELIGRAPNNDPHGAGMQVWRFHEDLSNGTSGWTKLSNVNAPLADTADAQEWYLPQYYRTIQCAYVKSKSNPSLVARGKEGIQIWDYDSTLGWKNISAIGPFTDAQGWTGPAYYNTIQCAYLDGLDADGKGQASLIGRGGNGIEVWKYQDNQWNKLSSGPAWADQYGWNQAPYYLTIQCADINGDGRDELLGRAPNNDPKGRGMQAWQWTGTTWGQLAMGPAWNDQLPNSNDNQTSWYEVQHFATIQTARVLGDSSSENLLSIPPVFPNTNNPVAPTGKAYAALLGRGFFSVQTWRYLSAFKTWTQTSAPFPVFVGQGRSEAYNYIRDDPRTFSGNDPRSIYPNIRPTDIETYIERLADLNNGSLPSGVTAAEWQTVYQQIRQELEYLKTVRSAQADFITNILSNTILDSGPNGILNDVHTKLYNSIPRVPTGSGNTVFFTVLEILASSAWALSALVAPEAAPLTAALIAAGTGLLSSASIGLSLVPQGGQQAKNYDTSMIQQMAQDIYNAAETGMAAADKAASTAAQDWGLLQTLGRLSSNPVMSDAHVIAMRSYRLYAYQKLAPLYWRRGSVNFQDLRMFATERDTDSTYQQPFKRVYEYGRYYQPPTNPEQTYFLSVIKHTIRAEYENNDSHPCDAAVYPNTGAFDDIFGKLDDTNINVLGASYEDVFLSNRGAGWNLGGGWFYSNRIHTGATFERLDDGQNNQELPPGPESKLPLKDGVFVETMATLAREPDTGDILVTISFRNAGTRKLSNIGLVDTRLGSMGVTPHARMTRLYGDKSETVQVRFPASVGASGQKTILRISGEHREGTFGGTYRVTLP